MARRGGDQLSLQDKRRVARKLDEIGSTTSRWLARLEPQGRGILRGRRHLGLKRARLAAFPARRGKAPSGRRCKPPHPPGRGDAGLHARRQELDASCHRGAARQPRREPAHDPRFAAPHREARTRGDLRREHFFDGYKADPEYALTTSQAAAEGGASVIVLCDTNGGSLPTEVSEIVTAVRARLASRSAFTRNNDCELGVANTVAAVQAGAVQVQGTMNGYGERTGNANLCSIVPVLKLKLGVECIGDEDLARWTEASAFMDEIANMPPVEQRPFVGRSAFAHKAGLHVDGLMKNALTFEHTDRRWSATTGGSWSRSWRAKRPSR